MSLAKCLKKLKIDSSHEDSIISGLASLTEQGNLEGYRKASLALDQAMNDTLDEQEDLHIQLEKQGYSFKEDSSVKDSKLLEEKLNNQGYTFTITPKNVRDFVAKDKTRETQATTATNLASKFGKRITWIDAKGDFGINGVVVPNIKDVIFLDVNTKYPAHAVMGHELSHHLEYDKPEVYKNLVTSMEGLLKNHKEYAEKYKIEGASHKDIVKEMIGDIIGDNFTKQDFWNKLADQDRSLFTKIADAIKAWLEQFIKSDNLGSDAFVKDVKKAREVIALAIAQYKDVQQPAQSAEAKFHKVWHGSPHDHDKFESSKIGTGEGAQAYGYGLYFAESRDVAEYYKKMEGKPVLYFDGKKIEDQTGFFATNVRNILAYVFAKRSRAIEETIEDMEFRASKHPNERAEIDAAIKEIKKLSESDFDKFEERRSHLYQVELAPEQDEYLLWDKPLSEQSEKVKDALEGNIPDHKIIAGQLSVNGLLLEKTREHNGLTGRDLYLLYKAKFAKDRKNIITGQTVKTTDSEAASKYLHSLGIRGIKYLDGSSRGKGEGNYNYVIFDDNDIKIEAKFSKVAAENTLIAQHNLSVKNLLHADRMGGLAAPSIAVTDKAHPLKGFGEITLLSDKDLVDPKQGAKTYGSDIYSPRYPQLSYDFSGKAIKKLNEILSDGIEKTGDREFYNDSLENDPFRELTHSSAAMYQFLKEQGADPELAFTKPKELPNKSFRPFADSNMDSFDLSKDEKFKEVVKEHYAQISEKEKIDDDAVSNLARAYARDVIAYRDAKKNIGKVDHQATNSSLFRQITDSNLRNKFDDFLVDIVNRVAPKERIFQGYTNSGNRRYIPHDIDNVIKLLKKDLRGGENFKYGLGSIRAKYSPQFKSIDQIRKSKNRLMDSETFDLVKKEIQTELDSLNESLASYGTFSGFDNVETMLSDAAKMGISRALKENGFENVPDSIKIDIQNFINKLKDMPTEYFEAKLLRAVKLGEFTAAIIPDDSTQQVKDILKKNGIEDIREYKAGDNEDRVKQINQVDRVMFSRAVKEIPRTIDIDNIDQLMNVLDKHKEVFVRWSAGPKYDMKKGAVSRDFSNSDVHKGLSAVPIKSGMSKSDVAKYVSEYSYARGGNEFTRSKGVEISAYIYTGEIVGSDSDGYPSIAPNKFIGKLSDKFINDLDEGMDAELKLREDIDEIENRLSNWTGDNIGLDITKSQLMKKEKELESILNKRSKGNVLPATININGVDRPTRNSEGKLIPNPEKFYEWFGDSKVVDDQGRPLTVYHGTKASFDKFEIGSEGKNTGTFGTWSVKRVGIFFAEDPKEASEFATQGEKKDGANVLPVSLSIINPADLSHGFEYDPELYDALAKAGVSERLMVNTYPADIWELFDDENGGSEFVAALKEAGYDGAFIVEQNPDTEENIKVWVAFDPKQIKSAIGNSGEFSSSSDDVRFSRVSKEMPKTININGVDRPTTNSEGKLIPNPEKFYAWFGDSAVVDEQGRPQVKYKAMHPYDWTKETANDPGPLINKIKRTTPFPAFNHGEEGVDIAGFFGDRETADRFTAGSSNSAVYPVYLSFQNPFILDAKGELAGKTQFGKEGAEFRRAVRSGSYDSVVILNTKDEGDLYVTLNPNQSKSAIGNNGEFSKDNDDIRFSKEAIPEETTYQKSQRTVQDKFNRFSVIRDWLKERGVKLTELSNVYDAEERYHAKVANQLEDFREKVRNPLIERIAKAGFTLSDVQDFLLAQHAAEANKQIQKVRNDSEALAYGITDEEANEYLSKVKPELVTLANELRDVTEQAKQLRLDAGILNKDITDNWDNTYKHYIPVKGDESIQGTGKGLNVKHKDKRRLGHEKRNEAVIENILMDYERAVMEVEKNRVGKYLVMFAAEANNPDLITVGQPEKRNILKENNSYAIVDSDGVIHSVYVNKIDAQRNAPKGSSIQKISDPRVISQASPVLAPNEVNVYMDGHAIRVQLNDDLLARAYANMGVESVGAIVEAGRVLNSYLSKVYTGYNPEFIVTNIIRDFTSGIVNLTGEEGTLMAVKAIGNYPKMFTDLFRYAVTRKSTELIDSYRANGGNTGAAYLSDMERLGKEISSEYASYQGVIANIKAGDGANAFRAAGRKVFNSTLKWIEHLNQAGENAMRLSAYKAMLDSGKTVEQASKVAKNITVNFNRRGEIGQTANALYLFFNASVQGSAAVLHANLKGNHKYQANALAVGMASLGYMLAAGLGGMDEEEYDKIDDTTKERNLIIGSEGSYVKIPIPYGYGFFFNTGRVIADAQRKGEFGKAPFRMAVNAVEELTPFGNLVNSDEINSEQVVGGVAPTALQIPYQMSTNTSLFTGKEIRPVSPFDNSQPEREQMFRNTKGTVYDDMAGLLSNAGFDVSPENIKFLTRTLTGGAGALVDTAVSSSKLKAQGAELDIKEMPFIRKFMGENTISNDRSAYYKAVEEAKKAAEEFSRARKNNDISSMKKIMEDKRELLAMDKYADKLRKVIKLSRDMQDSVRLNEEIPIAEKRLKLKELEKEEAKLYNNYLNVFKERVK